MRTKEDDEAASQDEGADRKPARPGRRIRSVRPVVALVGSVGRCGCGRPSGHQLPPRGGELNQQIFDRFVPLGEPLAHVGHRGAGFAELLRDDLAAGGRRVRGRGSGPGRRLRTRSGGSGLPPIPPCFLVAGELRRRIAGGDRRHVRRRRHPQGDPGAKRVDVAFDERIGVRPKDGDHRLLGIHPGIPPEPERQIPEGVGPPHRPVARVGRLLGIHGRRESDSRRAHHAISEQPPCGPVAMRPTTEA